MVTGDVVNAAARLQSLAEPGTVVAGERTQRAARGFRFEDLGLVELKGKADRVRIHPPLGGDGRRRRARGAGPPGPDGRPRRRDRILRSVFRPVASERRPHLVTIYGDAGRGEEPPDP